MSESISTHLHSAAQQLSVITDVPQLEADVLLAHVLNQSRSYLLAKSNEFLAPEIAAAFKKTIHRRLQGEPIAYITGHKEFWSLDLAITKDVLIPRPETELLVELVFNTIKGDKIQLADLGTGSGAIALAIASERSGWEIYATDQSSAALQVAQRNAIRLQIQNIVFLQGEWCQPISAFSLDVIVSNPPYLAIDDAHLQQGDLRFEPQSALVAGQDGLGAIADIILSACQHLKEGGFLFLEHGCEQGAAVRTLLIEAGYINIKTHSDLAGLERVTCGNKNSCSC